jgi:hypothetical protein
MPTVPMNQVGSRAFAQAKPCGATNATAGDSHNGAGTRKLWRHTPMHLVQILLPLADNTGQPFSEETFRRVRKELANRFGGLTAFSRAPAKGVWKMGSKETHDDIVIVEVMAETLDAEWWCEFRARTEDVLQQKKLVVRALPITEL